MPIGAGVVALKTVQKGEGKGVRNLFLAWDVRLPTLARVTRKVPEGATLPADEPPGITTLATAVRPGGGPLDYFTAVVREKEGVCAEMIYWKREGGGQVFNSGSIAAGRALSADPKLRTQLRNVLAQFGVPAKTKATG